jgi:diguanylate cyclase (GGDEF)-like protein
MSHWMSSFAQAPKAAFALCLALLVLVFSVHAGETRRLDGQWYTSVQTADYSPGQDPHLTGLAPVAQVAPSGGRFWFVADFSIQQDGRYVIDFKNTAIIDRFRHRIYDSSGNQVHATEGGLGNDAENPFFLRHGRELELKAGNYRLVSELESPFYLAIPEPYIDTLSHYRQAIRGSNALTLLGLGVFLGLGIYYAALSFVRDRRAERMYALFILGNFLFNGSALLVFPQLLGMHWIYLVSLPILFSNIAYILFVTSLLEIGPDSHPRLYRAGRWILGVMCAFLVIAAFLPNWSLELDRYGVGLFLLYGLSAGIIRARQGSMSARLYLVAIGVFFVLGGVAITQAQLSGIYTLYIEHVGLLAVAVEVILLALVLSYQFAQLHYEREQALARMEASNRIAHTDALTGLANRYALDIELEELPPEASLTFLDLDGLKYYNDRFGHARGDELLRGFAGHLSAFLGNEGRLFRIGGDEFAITLRSGDLRRVEAVLYDTMACLHTGGFEFAGVSAGTAFLYEAQNRNELKHLADTRMYENKRKRKQAELDLQLDTAIRS